MKNANKKIPVDTGRNTGRRRVFEVVDIPVGECALLRAHSTGISNGIFRLTKIKFDAQNFSTSIFLKIEVAK